MVSTFKTLNCACTSLTAGHTKIFSTSKLKDNNKVYYNCDNPGNNMQQFTYTGIQHYSGLNSHATMYHFMYHFQANLDNFLRTFIVH